MFSERVRSEKHSELREKRNLSPCRVRSLLLSNFDYQGRGEYEKTHVVETKKKPLKVSVERPKIEGKMEI